MLWRAVVALMLVATGALAHPFWAGRQQPRPVTAAFTPNPAQSVIEGDFPDPMVLREGDVYYAYATTAGWEQPGHHFPILRSTDLQTWELAGEAFTSPPGWVARDVWAPSVIKVGRTYHLYYSAYGLNGVHCLGAAVSPSPAGPFSDQGVVACGDANGRGYIDPAPFLWHGQVYLYFSVDTPYHSISLLPLAPDLVHPAAPRVELFGVTQAWETGSTFTTVEAPFLYERSGRFYLLYSGNDWRSDYAVGYAVADSPFGPFQKAVENPILSTGGDLLGPGGGSVFEDAEGRPWLVYHAWTPGGRSLHLARLAVSNGTVGVVVPQPLTALTP